jgi:hypothetical protein
VCFSAHHKAAGRYNILSKFCAESFLKIFTKASSPIQKISNLKVVVLKKKNWKILWRTVNQKITTQSER